MHEKLLVFDTETIPDIDACDGLLDLAHVEDEDEYTNIKRRREAMTNYHLAVTDGKNPFLRQPFHKIVAISYLVADVSPSADGYENISLNFLKSGGTEDSSEEDLIKGFFDYFSKIKPRIVTYNGRTFDMPVLKYRAMKYGITSKWLHRSGDKWNNYMQRYSMDWHCDLIDAFSDYGASARVKMNEVCTTFGLPGKIGTDGSKVTEMYDAGNVGEIRDYCETDVLNTYLLYLKWAFGTSKIDQKTHIECTKELKNYLKSEEKTHLAEFLSAWSSASASSRE